MWKTVLNFAAIKLPRPQPCGKRVENVWKKIIPVEKNDKLTVASLFPQAKKTLACGNVENFI